MPSRPFQTQSSTGVLDSSSDRSLGDIIWGRPVFRPPLLPNPRTVFDPMPFRTQLFTTGLRPSRFARR